MVICTGTSGYDYPEWVGAERFYPPSLAGNRTDWLTYYASQFSLVELNFTYYGETTPKQMAGMLRRVEPGRRLALLEGEFAPRADFAFVIKAYAGLTHEISRDWRPLARKFGTDIAPLGESGKLLGVLAQFPSRFHSTLQTVGYIMQLAEELAPRQLIVEFRHRSWFNEGPTARLREQAIVVAGVDAPLEAGLPRTLDDVAGQGIAPPESGADCDGKGDPLPFAYYRLHGRRDGAWWSGDAASRYEYHYAGSQLERFALKLAQSQAPRTYLLFNNHRHAAAARNARRLEEILKGLYNSHL